MASVFPLPLGGVKEEANFSGNLVLKGLFSSSGTGSQWKDWALEKRVSNILLGGDWQAGIRSHRETALSKINYYLNTQWRTQGITHLKETMS